jgi:hypothetical protein
MAKTIIEQDPEIEAISKVNAALNALEAGAQQRVLDYVARKLGLAFSDASSGINDSSDEDAPRRPPPQSDSASHGNDTDDLDDINAVAKKWMRRSGLTAHKLSSLFSIGGDEIDLIAKKVPGKTKRDRMRSVILLKAIAAYLASGAARVSHEQVKEACLHYDAFDNTNFSKYLKGMAVDISGTAKSGYSLTARGIASATDIVREATGTGPNP